MLKHTTYSPKEPIKCKECSTTYKQVETKDIGEEMESLIFCTSCDKWVRWE